MTKEAEFKALKKTRVARAEKHLTLKDWPKDGPSREKIMEFIDSMNIFGVEEALKRSRRN